MAVRRDKDTGETIEEPTRMLDGGGRGRAGAGPGEPPTEPGGRRGADAPPASDPAGAGSPFEAPTRKVGTARRTEAVEERTRLLRPGSGPADAGAGIPEEDPMADPPVGWLVVIDGPGRGRVRPLGYGVNTLGRGEGSRVRLDFGDDRISREGHATVTYDPRGRKYYLQHGGGKNLTYLGGEPVLAPTALEAMRDISIGGTTLRFVPLCGPEFDWQDAVSG